MTAEPGEGAARKLINDKAPFVHTVLFRLPPGTDPEKTDGLIDDIRTQLEPLPTIEGLWAGRPASTKTPERPIVDDDYDVGLMVLFKDEKALNDYLNHPTHAAFARKWDALCTVRVFDFVK